MQGPNWK